MANHNREELIEEAAKAIGEYEGALDRKRGDESQRIWGHRGAFVADCYPTHEGRASAALAVFEQAHTPTDDEQEALFDIINRAMIEAWTDADEYAYAPAYIRDAILAAGFRRAAQGEPTDAQVLAALNAWYAKEREQNGWPIGSNAAELPDYSPQAQDRMRAALRVAGGVE